MAEKEKFIYGYHEEGFDIPGCIANGISKETAETIYDQMIDFAKYAFNKSHAACYAAIAMQTAFLKANYPLEFASGLLTSVMDKTEKLAIYINEYRKKGIKILPPDINTCESAFTIKDNSLCYGLSSIKNVGDDAIKEIFEEHKKNGEYKDFGNFLKRNFNISKRMIEYLIKAGALDSMHLSRRTMLNSFSKIIDGYKKDDKMQIEGQMSLFDIMDIPENPIYELPEYSQDELLKMEKEATGLYISGHPLDSYQKFIDSRNITQAYVFNEENEDIIPPAAESKIAIIGILQSYRIVFTKKDSKTMAILTLEDATGTVDVVVFPKVYQKYTNTFIEGNIYCIKGTVKENKGRLNVAAESVYNMNRAYYDIFVCFDSFNNFKKDTWKLNDFISKNKGSETSLIIYIKNEHKYIQFRNYCLNGSKECFDAATSIWNKYAASRYVRFWDL